MKAITRNFTDTVDIYNLGEVGSSLTYSLIASGVKCHIQNIDGSFIEDNTGMFGKNYLIFADYRTDITDGTKLVTTIDSKVYTLRVVEVENFIFRGTKRHMEVRCRLFDNIT